MGIRDFSEHVGFVAQAVQKVIPEAVTENEKGYLLVNNDPILWTMLNAIKEQQREIQELRAELKKNMVHEGNLKSRLARLERKQDVHSSAAVAVHFAQKQAKSGAAPVSTLPPQTVRLNKVTLR